MNRRPPLIVRAERLNMFNARQRAKGMQRANYGQMSRLAGLSGG